MDGKAIRQKRRAILSASVCVAVAVLLTLATVYATCFYWQEYVLHGGTQENGKHSLLILPVAVAFFTACGLLGLCALTNGVYGTVFFATAKKEVANKLLTVASFVLALADALCVLLLLFLGLFWKANLPLLLTGAGALSAGIFHLITAMKARK